MSNLKLILIAKETQKILKDKYYVVDYTTIDISKSIDYTVDNTVYYEDINFVNTFCGEPIIEVTEEKTDQAAFRLLSANKENIAVLNFASATNPGGGWLHGARAQEEDLCRKSTLFSSLRKKTSFYNKNILLDNPNYTDGIIYSPNVLFFRDDSLNLLKDPFSVAVITSPAPNVSLMSDPNQDELFNVLKTRIIKILRVAIKNYHKNLVLGAWGCGVFGNDPSMVCEAFNQALLDYPYFKNICFAVYDSRPNKEVYLCFKDYFNNL